MGARFSSQSFYFKEIIRYFKKITINRCRLHSKFHFLCHLKAVGCDHLLHSRKEIDRCGVCGGKADTCIDESGSFTGKIVSK